MNENEIIDYINLFKSASPELIERIFLNGGCYKFHLILKKLYPDAIPYKVGYRKHSIEHIVSKIGDRYFDIKGVFNFHKSGYIYIDKLKEKDLKIVEKFKY